MRFLQALGSTLRHPGWLALPALIFLLGIALAAISGPLKIDKVLQPEDKEVGYLLAPNWILSPILLFPLLGLLTFLLVRQIDEALPKLIRSRMVVNRGSRKAARTTQSLKRRFYTILGGLLPVWLLLSALASVVSYDEWSTICAAPLDDMQSLEDVRQYNDNTSGKKIEVDWSIAGVFKENVDRQSNKRFSFAALVVLQSLELWVLALFLIVTMAFGAFILSLSLGKRSRLVPNLKSEDPRKGFELFEGAGFLILMAVLVTFLALYFTKLQNTFMRVEGSPHIFEFVFGPVREVIAAGKGQALADLGGLIELVQGMSDFSSTWANIGGLFSVSILWIVVPFLLLLASAYVAQRLMTELLDPAALAASDFRREFGVTKSDAVTALDEMSYWPYRYFRVNFFLGLAVLLTGILFIPGIAIALFTVALTTVLGGIVLQIRKLGQK